MYMLLYGHKNEAKRLARMCYYTAMKLRSKVNVYVLLYSHKVRSKRYYTAMKDRSKG